MEPGAEFSPEQYLPQPIFPDDVRSTYIDNITRSILATTVRIEEVADEVIPGFPPIEKNLPDIPYGKEYAINVFLRW